MTTTNAWSDVWSQLVPKFGQILFSIVLFSAIYIGLFALGFFLIRRRVLAGPDDQANRKEV